MRNLLVTGAAFTILPGARRIWMPASPVVMRDFYFISNDLHLKGWARVKGYMRSTRNPRARPHLTGLCSVKGNWVEAKQGPICENHQIIEIPGVMGWKA